ncbi:MAG: hypothetical protein IJT89_13075 [Bacteroidaceae bacterium]|nr:hypothetical protein [Bacteroidaceae bacterium]
MLIKRRLKKTLTVFGQPIAAKQLYKIKPAAKPQAKQLTENGQPKPKKPATNGCPKSLPKSQPPNVSKKATPACKKS